MRKPKAYYSWEYAIFISGVVLTGGLIITLLAGCVTVKRDYVPVIEVPTDNNVLGWTTCDQAGNIVILYKETVDPNYFRYLMLHENVHVWQIRKYGDCEEFMKAYSASKSMQLQIEGEAECVTLAFARAEGYYINLSVVFTYYKVKYKDLPEEEVLEALYCMRRPT